MVGFAKLTRVIALAVERLKSGRRNPYRPEKHYMRGSGPKSKPVSPARGGGSPNAT